MSKIISKICKQKKNESHLPKTQSGEIYKISEVWSSLFSYGTTIFAAPYEGNPAIFVVPRPRYCFWPQDIAKVRIEIKFKPDPISRIDITLIYEVPEIYETNKYTIDATGCYKEGKYFYGFLEKASKKGKIFVFFKGENNYFVQTCKTGFFTKLKIKKILKTLEQKKKSKRKST